MKKHILIVEDESILYERLNRILKEENYTTDEYTSSFDEAILRINAKRPDLVLLDIDLKGDRTGIDLGRELSENYKIPFIYVTQLDDTNTFYKGLETNHEQFIVKTKPRLNTTEILRAISTVLRRHENTTISIKKEGVIGLLDYLENLKVYGEGEITKVPVRFEHIAFFTIDSFVNLNNEKETTKTNYLWFQTINNKKDYYFLYISLKKLYENLPPYFARVNESSIVNLSYPVFNGRINGSRLSIMKKEFTISSTYRKEFNIRIDRLYLKERG